MPLLAGSCDPELLQLRTLGIIEGLQATSNEAKDGLVVLLANHLAEVAAGLEEDAISIDDLMRSPEQERYIPTREAGCGASPPKNRAKIKMRELLVAEPVESRNDRVLFADHPDVSCHG